MTERRTIAWFSCGAASAVATKLCPAAVPVYCATGSEHPDNVRFAADCEKWFERPITTIRNEKYADTWDVWIRERYLAGVHGAPCTRALKLEPRLAFQRPDDIHVFGYTADKTDRNRADRLRTNFPELTIVTPLIDRGLKKDACLGILQRAGIERPIMYDLGFLNNNCLACPKVTNVSYWALVREHFPEQFERMAALERELGAHICAYRGKRITLDEIPKHVKPKQRIRASCDFLCQIAVKDMK